MTEGWAEGGEGPEEIGWNLEPKVAEIALCWEESEQATTGGAGHLCVHIISIRQTGKTQMLMGLRTIPPFLMSSLAALLMCHPVRLINLYIKW